MVRNSLQMAFCHSQIKHWASHLTKQAAKQKADRDISTTWNENQLRWQSADVTPEWKQLSLQGN
jgi:hypothetical protein